VPLLWASCPLVRAPTPGPSGPLRAASACPGATPTSLQLRWGGSDLLRWMADHPRMGCSAASTGGGVTVSCDGGSKSAPRSSGSGVAGIRHPC